MAVLADAIVFTPSSVGVSYDCNPLADARVFTKPRLVFCGEFDESGVVIDSFCAFNGVKCQDR